jgi:hypothetical protein
LLVHREQFFEPDQLLFVSEEAHEIIRIPERIRLLEGAITVRQADTTEATGLIPIPIISGHEGHERLQAEEVQARRARTSLMQTMTWVESVAELAVYLNVDRGVLV